MRREDSAVVFRELEHLSVIRRSINGRWDRSKIIAIGVVCAALSVGFQLLAPSPASAKAPTTVGIPTFRLVRSHGKLVVQHGRRVVPVAHASAVGHAGDCAVSAYTPFNIYGNNYSTRYWRSHASMDCPLGFYSQLQTCMSQLITGGWHNINTYAGRPACGDTGINTWVNFNLESVNIDLTINRWYSTWAWCYNYGFNEKVVLDPSQTPGVRVR